MKRGDLVLCVIAGDYGKPRPALVIQSDLYNETHASVVVLPVTSHRVDAGLFRIDLNAESQTGLVKDSQVMVDKVTAIRRDRIRESIGVVPASVLEEVESSLRHFLELG